jgi:hypothetical protein
LNPKKDSTKTAANPTKKPAKDASSTALESKEFKIQTFMELSGEALNFHKPGMA